MVVHPGSFGKEGATGVTSKGTPMICSRKSPGERARWRRMPATSDRVMSAYTKLTVKPGEYLSLARLRDELADVSREDLDRVLLELDTRRALQLEPDPHRIAITERAKAAAIYLGGEDKHLVVI